MEASLTERIQCTGISKVRRAYTSICPFVMMEDLIEIALEKKELCSYRSSSLVALQLNCKENTSF